MPRPRTIQKSASLFRDWRVTNNNAEILDDVAQLTERHERAIEELRRKALLWAAGGKVKRFVIESIQDDYLTCKPAKSDGTANTDAASVNIARPEDLRGEQVVETEEEGVVTYRELIRPAYAVGGNDVFAAKVSNGTGVTDGDGNDVVWIDLTPRCWRPASFLANLCIVDPDTGGEITKHAIIWGGPVYRLPSEDA